MKQFFKNICIIMLSLLFIILLFKNPSISKNSINYSFNIWLNNIVPSLFPIIIINDILINYNFIKIVSPLFYKLFNKIFNLSYGGTYFFIMSLFIGTPANAMLLDNLLKNKYIDINEANKLIYVCYFSNPLFLYNILSLIFDKYIVIKIIIVHYIANFITLFIIRNKYNYKSNNMIINEKKSFFDTITESSKKAINSMITILGIISFYMLIVNYFKFNCLLTGLFEITNGLFSLIKYSSSNKVLLALIIINFGGLSIFSQIKSILEDTNIVIYNYIKGRLLQIIFSLLLFLL